MKKLIIAPFVFAVVLFLWSGITQMFPWGVPNTQNVSVQTEIPAREISNLIKLEPNSLTSENFDEQFNHKISTYSTNKTLSWIVTQPLKSDYSGYFIKELITQLIVGVFLTILLMLTVKLELKSRLAILIIVALTAIAGTYGQLMNWWGLPANYGLGAGFNLLIGWFISGFIIAKFMITSKTGNDEF